MANDRLARESPKTGKKEGKKYMDEGGISKNISQERRNEKRADEIMSN